MTSLFKRFTKSNQKIPNNKATLTISPQQGITIKQEGHDLSLFLASYLLYCTFNNGNKQKNTWLDKNIRKLIPLTKQYLGVFDIKFIYELQSHPIRNINKNNIILNIYYSICNDVQLQNKLQDLMDIHKIPFKCIDLTSNLVPEITETNRTICVACNSKLKRNIQYRKDSKGSVGIIYTNKHGPKLTVHYIQQCTNDNCKAKYYHGRYETEKGVYIESADDTYQMNTKCTFFDNKNIDEVNSFNLDDGSGVTSFSDKYQARFKEEFDDIELTLQLLNQKLGNRNSFSAALINQRVLDAVCTRRLQTRIEQDLGLKIFISWTEIEKYRKEQSKIILKPISGLEKVLKKQWIDSNDLFNLMYDKYFEQLNKTTDKWLRYVPVKDGQILLKHFLLMGDGGQGLTHPICGYPMSLYQHALAPPITEADKQCYRFLRCCAAPQKGNDSSKSIVTCIHHTKYLSSLGLSLRLINNYCKYINVKDRLVSIKKETDKNKKVIEKLEKQIEKYSSEDIETFNNISRKIIIKIRKSPRNLDRTYANMNESQQYVQDEQKLSDIEKIYNMNNVNPTILSNPKIADFIESERHNIDVWNDTDGCRKGYHVIDHNESDPLYSRTGGLQNWMTHDGFILYLGENVHRETPTEVLIGLGTLLTSTSDHIEYSKRIMGVGYDMMCCLYGRLRTLITLACLSPIIISLFIALLAYLFIDLFHIRTHKNILCLITGLFHPKGKKFRKQRIETKGANDSIIEQNWTTTNKLTYAKNLGQRRFSFMLYDFKKRHNDKNWIKLEKAGYVFVPIERTTIIRDFTQINTELPTTHDLLHLAKYQQLKIVNLKSETPSKRNNTDSETPNSKRRKLNTLNT